LPIDEGIEVLTGVAAGARQVKGNYPKGTINYLVDKRLRRMAVQLRSFQGEEKKEAPKINL